MAMLPSMGSEFVARNSARVTWDHPAFSGSVRAIMVGVGSCALKTRFWVLALYLRSPLWIFC